MARYWNSIDTVERHGETYILQQRVRANTGSGYVAGMDQHRLIPLEEAVNDD